uniref:Uncharacterized protein n=1 Tax=Anguilla anguilla TaxID=7936 RepID=A0A0E9U2U0_ANGAN
MGQGGCQLTLRGPEIPPLCRLAAAKNCE